jgi:hypothetical protein
MFCSEVMLVYMERSSVKIGGPNKTVEIDESKFGRRKYHRVHPVKGQWVFGVVERESGGTFIAPVQDRTALTLSAVIRDWIEHGTNAGLRTTISDRRVTSITPSTTASTSRNQSPAYTNTIKAI